MNAEAIEPKNSNAILAERRYLRERQEPSFSDPSYLALADLKDLIRKTALKMNGPLLDYGCGGSPYQNLFINCPNYIRADMLAGPGVDMVLNPDGSTSAPDGAFNAILSAQVLEHVANPSQYLGECNRLLQKGGAILLTTHGLFLEHKCPDDFYRWTAQGLEELLRNNGFEILESYKITAGTRGAIQLMHYLVETFRYQPKSLRTLVLRVIRKIYNLTLLPCLNICGKWMFGEFGVVPGLDPLTVYVGVGVFARKL